MNVATAIACLTSTIEALKTRSITLDAAIFNLEWTATLLREGNKDCVRCWRTAKALRLASSACASPFKDRAAMFAKALRMAG